MDLRKENQLFEMYGRVADPCLKLSEGVPLPNPEVRCSLLTLITTNIRQYLHFSGLH